MTPKILAFAAAVQLFASDVPAQSAMPEAHAAILPAADNLTQARAAAGVPDATVDSFAQALAARHVADFARRLKDPVAMLTAARMLREIPISGGDGGGATFTSDGLFDEAKRLAKGDRAMLMQIMVAQSTGSRGVSTSAFGKGLVRSVQIVGARAGFQFTVQAKGSEQLRVGAIGDVGTALAMRMRDGAGRVVCLDDNGDYGPVCQLTPKAATSYRIEILNKSAVGSRAVILSN